MIVIRVQPVHPFFEAISLLTQISTQADVNFSPEAFSITVSQHFPRFIAVLHMRTEFFSSFLVTQNLNARISLDSFHTTLMEAKKISAITINSLSKNSASSSDLRTQNQPIWSEELKLLPPEEEVGDIGNIDFKNCVSIDTRDFRGIVQEELSATYRDRICISVTDSQVKFSVGAKESIFTQKGRQYIIIDRQEEVDVQFQFTLHPTSFFHDLIDKSRRVWFLKTILIPKV